MHKILLLTALAFLFGCKEENKPATTQKEPEQNEFLDDFYGKNEEFEFTSAEQEATTPSEPEFKKEIGSMTDPRDDKTYKTTKIGNQVWMAENLNFEAEESWCHDNKPANCKKYGRLYGCDKSLCPTGWHLPDTTEWKTLIDFAGGEKVAGNLLKATSGWDENGNGEDKFGFAAMPGGIIYTYSDLNNAFGVGIYSNLWSSSQDDRNNNICFHCRIKYNDQIVDCVSDVDASVMSVRCIKD